MPYGRAHRSPGPTTATARLLQLGGLLSLIACEETSTGPDAGPPAPLGTAIVAWSFQNEGGEDVTCEAAGVGSVRVQLGGEPRTAACGDEMSIRFTDLLPGRFPVVLERLSNSGAVVETHLDNLDVVGNQETTFSHVFAIAGGGTTGNGTLDIRWFIDGEDPALGCGASGGTTVRVEVVDGPAEVAPFEAPCTEARRTVENVRQGNYRVLLTLVDMAGETVGFPAIENMVFVTQNMTETVLLDVVTRLPVSGRLLAQWTVSSTTTRARCAGPPECFVEVGVRTDVSQSVSTTATAGFSTGAVFFEDLPVGRSPEGAGLRATYQLIDRALGRLVLDTEIVRDLVLQPARTSTITVDLALD